MFLDVLIVKTLENPCFLLEILGSRGEMQGSASEMRGGNRKST